MPHVPTVHTYKGQQFIPRDITHEFDTTPFASRSSVARKARARTGQAITVANSYIVNNNPKFEASFRRLYPKTWDALHKSSEPGAIRAIADEAAKYGYGPYGPVTDFKVMISKLFAAKRKAAATVQKQQFHKKQVNKQIRHVAGFHRRVPTSVWKRHYSKAWSRRQAEQRAFDESPQGFFGLARLKAAEKHTQNLARSGGQKRGRGPDDTGESYYISDGRKRSYHDDLDLGPADEEMGWD